MNLDWLEMRTGRARATIEPLLSCAVTLQNKKVQNNQLFFVYGELYLPFLDSTKNGKKKLSSKEKQPRHIKSLVGSAACSYFRKMQWEILLSFLL